MQDCTAPRRPLSKTLRFSILERDGFRCRYCGATPDNGALEVDHIIPVSDGGSNEPTNLITSCEPCNKGKGRKKLTAGPLPDIDAMTDEALAFTNSVQKWRKAHKKREKTVHEAAQQMLSEHGLSIPLKSMESAIRQYGVAEVDHAADVTSAKNLPWRQQLPYLFGVLRRRQAEEVEPAPMPTYVKPPKFQTRNGCVFGGKDTCPKSGNGCLCVIDGEYTACDLALEIIGGWGNTYAMKFMAELAKPIHAGDVTAAGAVIREWLGDE